MLLGSKFEQNKYKICSLNTHLKSTAENDYLEHQRILQ